MRRCFRTMRWALAGLLLLSGCGETSRPSTAPTSARTSKKAAARAVEPRRLHAANHYSLLPLPADISAADTAEMMPKSQITSGEFRRLPKPNQTAVVNAPRHHGSSAKFWHVGSSPAIPVDLTQADWPSRVSCVPQVAMPNLNRRLPDTFESLPADSATARPDLTRQVSPRIYDLPPTKPELPSLDSAYPRDARMSTAWVNGGSSFHSVSERANGIIDRGFEMAEKGAIYSAKTEFKQALRVLSQALDAHYGGQEFSAALAAGWTALEEADDFAAHGQQGPVVNVELIVGLHQTPILKPYDLRPVSPVLAMQHYYVYAEEALLDACGHAPVASRAMFGLGKLHMVLGEISPSAERLHGPKAMAFHQVALLLDSQNYLAANELGVMLARCGKLPEARDMLQQSVALHPLPETWRNLSVVHQRLGEMTLASQSHANWQYASQQSSVAAGAGAPAVQWVTPQVFAQETNRDTSEALLPQPAPLPRQAAAVPGQKSGFLWW